jgi:type I restriction enzyme S subunit
MRDSWTETTLGEVVSAQPGYAFNSDLFSETIGTPLIRIRDLKKQTRTETKYTGDFDPQYRVTSGDFLIGMDGEFRCHEWLGENALLNQRVCRLKNFDLKRVVPRMVYLLINSHLQSIERATSFTTVKHISTKQVENIVVWLPGLREQQRIVDVFIAVDAYIAALQRQVDDVRFARNAVLHELLTAGGNDWTETTLGSHINIVMGQAPPGNDCNKNGVGIPFVKAGEFTDGFPVIREWTTNPLRYAKLGDTLICVVGATCGKLSQGIDCAIGRSVAALQPLETIDGQFLWNFMTMKVQEMRSGSRGSAQGVITKDDLADLKLVLPPLTEQQQIAEMVSAMDDVIGAAQEAVSDAQELRSGLLSDLLSGNHEIPESYDRLLGVA